MKYCLTYNRNSKCLNEADEVKLRVADHHKLTDILDYLKTMPAGMTYRRILLDITKVSNPEDILKEYSVIVSVYPNITFIVTPETQVPALVPFFYNYPINTWEKLIGAISAGVTDVYITDELGFDLVDVSKICKANQVTIRVYPDVAQSSSIVRATSDAAHFFIRPDDEFIYEPFVDVYEFFCDSAQQDVIYKIYKSHEWPGPLDYIIKNFNEKIKNDTFLPYFADNRIKCKKKCLQGRCDLCTVMKDFGRSLTDTLSIKVIYPENYNGATIEEVIENSNLHAIDLDENFAIDK